MEAITTKRNFVFISYNHKDVKWAKWLQKKLEWYRLPTEIHNEFSDSRYIRPVFRDRDSLTSGVLNDELRNHLETSQFLVVICSPNSAQSEWVSDEIKAFIEMGRLNKIVPFVIDGSPQDYSHSDIAQPLMGECFPLALRQWNKDHHDMNLLGIAVTDDGKTDRQKAFIRLVAHLLGVDFDILWQRHKRYVRHVISLLSFLVVVALALAYWFIIPVNVRVTIKDDCSQLPGMERGILSFNGSEYSLSKPDTVINVNSLPGYNRMKKVPLSFHADRYYANDEKMMRIGMWVNQDITLQLHRDSTFAIFSGKVYDGEFENHIGHPIKDAKVKVGRYETLTDDEGWFYIYIPLSNQEKEKPITIEKQGYQPYFRKDESPDKNLSYLLYR